MAIVKWVNSVGGGSGDTQASPYTISEAIDYINGAWALSDHLDIRIFEAVTLAADPSVITVTPASTAIVIWSGWIGTAAVGSHGPVDVDANSAADFIWRWNTTDTLFEYMYWRFITAHDCSGSIAVPWEFTAKPIRNVAWSDCVAYGNNYGWSFNSSDDPNSYWKWERCQGYSNTLKGWNLPDAPE